MFSHYFRFNRLDHRLAEYRAKLHRMALAWCGDPVLADDLVQDTLTRALEKQEQLKDDDRLGAWLYKILHNCWMEHLRTQRPTMDIDEMELACTDCPEKQLADDQLAEQVRAAVETLPVGQCQVMTLIDLEGCSYEQVSAILDIPVGTVMSRLSRARDTMKKRLQGIRNTDNVHYLRRVK
ncbi:RNA polymerase sigma factor [Thiothrix lacustris]|uniref:Sigma-70 family RNA polymerase sigma factor n=1 Tax=Thiothrix lacustris TaxID=525917 RepID=A0ABY9MMH7_9GAMM|nr:sigma-70 family RNA polymerase sigma factor [Thiothrix lacustris]WML89415.1 sigma-70 family RNA polymerase sigma factor [Thiothrix lacustris]WMP16048.1 sigma-70 family RNA polymerase sigma factor [Thiothrix lacustris]